MPAIANSDLRAARNKVLAVYYCLYVVLLINSVEMTVGLSITTVVIWLIQVLPLALFISGLHRVRIRTYQWLSFVVLMYFVHGVLTAFTPDRLLVGLLEIAASTLLFCSLIIFIRKYPLLTASKAV